LLVRVVGLEPTRFYPKVFEKIKKKLRKRRSAWQNPSLRVVLPTTRRRTETAKIARKIREI